MVCINMDIFGSGDDEDDEEYPKPAGQARDTEAGGGGPTEIEQRVETTVDDVRSGRLRHADVVGRLDGSTEDRLVAARALVRAALHDPGAVGDVADGVIDRLAERELSRSVAESLLRSAEDLRTNGLDYATVAEGSLDALEEAHRRFESVRTGRPYEALGGGASEVVLAAELREYAGSVQGRRQLVVEATADAFEAVPKELARHAGLDPIDALVEMRTGHEMGDAVGVGTASGEVLDARELAVDEREVQARLTDGVALAGIVALTQGTVTQLGTLTGRDPYRG